MKIVVTGSRGQLGFDMLRQLRLRGHEAVGADVEEMDITDPDSVFRFLNGEKPDGIIHCAAYTAVDRAESEKKKCRDVNANGTGHIVEYCRQSGCRLIYLSTDYVFNGEDGRPWEPDDEPAPLNFYGQTKYEGEQAVRKNLSRYYIVRISWVFGRNGSNFVRTMLRLGRERGSVSVVDDQKGSPTYTADLAVLLADMIEREEYGTYHASNQGVCTWYQFACEIFRQAGMEDVAVTPVASGEFPAKARRPRNSVMNKAKLEEHGFAPLPPWQDALRRYLQETGQMLY